MTRSVPRIGPNARIHTLTSALHAWRSQEIRPRSLYAFVCWGIRQGIGSETGYRAFNIGNEISCTLACICFFNTWFFHHQIRNKRRSSSFKMDATIFNIIILPKSTNASFVRRELKVESESNANADLANWL